MDLKAFMTMLDNIRNESSVLSVEQFIETVAKVDPQMAIEIIDVINAGPRADKMSTRVGTKMYPEIARSLIMHATDKYQRKLKKPSLMKLLFAYKNGKYDPDAGDDLRIGVCNNMINLIGGRHRISLISIVGRPVLARITVRVYSDAEEMKASYAQTHMQVGASGAEMRTQWMESGDYPGIKKADIGHFEAAVKFVIEQQLDQNRIWPAGSEEDIAYLYDTVLPYYRNAFVQFYHEALNGVDKDFLTGLMKRGRLAPLLVSAYYNPHKTIRMIKAAGDLRSLLPEAVDDASPSRALRTLFSSTNQRAALSSVLNGGGGYGSGNTGATQMATEVCIALYRYMKGEDLKRWTIPKALDSTKGGYPLMITGSHPKTPKYVKRFENAELDMIQKVVGGANRLTTIASKSGTEQPRLFD